MPEDKISNEDILREISLLKYKVQQIEKHCVRDEFLEYRNVQRGASIAMKWIMSIASLLSGIVGVLVGTYLR